ncbi:MAG: glycosyltransferase family 2 protein [Anaerolineales bacterium]
MSTFVSIIVPCFNEERTIGFLLESIFHQSYPLDNIEVIIADGISTDGTRQIVEAFKAEHPKLSIRLIDNPKRIIPAALNRAIEHAKGDVLIRLDAHSVPADDYVERCVSTIMRTGAANVGGVWEIKPSGDHWMARAIAIAAGHPLGAGDARYRTGGEAGATDTVPFGCFPRDWIERVGFFEEELETNEDYEFNVRLKQAGGVVFFDPAIRSIYYARPDLISLGKQYARYGYWKARMLIRFPSSLR